MAQVASSAKGTIDAELFVVRNDLYYVYVGRGGQPDLRDHHRGPLRVFQDHSLTRRKNVPGRTIAVSGPTPAATTAGHARIPAAVTLERSHSGLVQRFAKPPGGVTCLEGSNPSLSASLPRETQPRAPVAQWIERQVADLEVVGSSPAGRANNWT